ncbi:hypothetical protein LN565_01930 [Xanthomonas euvesicatoria pv. euvesicatoria]|uniref:DUF1772 domain-containing protein n=2 Tax=Xanthomonas euvesicatoria TaxID=456327 RepID=A0ABS8LPQ1_XANEU|nr:hypothetical protein [Xanthomonas euvesicatoria]MBZ2848497.1 hypothetical protein [Xanthomonas perforans]AOY67487.1 hypothetical protein BHE83_13515 [Xanthomonas euvesicatoria pv. vesicatoria str. 85-10]KHL60057.1 membrane protein [Xanthomonas euvesicatoria]KLA49705.1 membrane protein [Xanthomonas euvesicatoria]KLA50684.1 membrane protein [Xanthomonas euvesicatoria]
MSAVRPASARQRGGFVTPLAWVSLLLGAVSVLANLMQIAMIAMIALAPGAASLGLPEGITLPPSWQWLINHALSLSVAGVVLSAAFCWLSWALLQRREWARRGCVAVLLVTGLLNFGGLALIGPLFDGVQTLLPADVLQSPEWPQMQARLQATQQMALVLTGLGALAIGCVHAALAWRLCTPAVRAEFSQAERLDSR